MLRRPGRDRLRLKTTLSQITIAGMVLVAACGCSRSQQRPLTHDAYIWQRLWTPALRAAMAESGRQVRCWRMLAAEVSPAGNWTEIAVDRASILASAKPVVAVFRIDGQGLLRPDLIEKISTIAERWTREGLPVSGVEVDHDCAAGRLPPYALFLRALRNRLSRRVTLSITALPSWIGSSYLSSVLANVDENVLQVHSVIGPKNGLFNRQLAERWTRRWSSISPTPFRLALPTYWSQVTWNQEGKVVSIESEVPRYGVELGAQEVYVSPQEVSAFVQMLQNNRPQRLAGLAWFRLPTEEDSRAWSASTWHRVMEGQPLPAVLPTVRVHIAADGAQDVFLLNNTEIDQPLPEHISISNAECEFADALPPYTVERSGRTFLFVSGSKMPLHPKQQRTIGWIRCAHAEVLAHVY